MKKTVELFCGTKSFSKVARKLGHETFTVDMEKTFLPDLVHDLSVNPYPETLNEKIREADIIWLSPPCTTLSMASGRTHWNGERFPKTWDGIHNYYLIKISRDIAEYCIENEKIFFIENPMARARWFLPKEWLTNIWYCRYGDRRAKPTDIFTNLYSWNGRRCSNGNNDCHEKAPRGSKTGTQGLKGSANRAVIPEDLFYEIFENYDSSVWNKIGDFQ